MPENITKNKSKSFTAQECQDTCVRLLAGPAELTPEGMRQQMDTQLQFLVGDSLSRCATLMEIENKFGLGEPKHPLMGEETKPGNVTPQAIVDAVVTQLSQQGRLRETGPAL